MGNSTYHTGDHSHYWGKKIPELTSGLSKSLKEFRKTTNEIKDEVNATAEDVKSSVDKTEE